HRPSGCMKKRRNDHVAARHHAAKQRAGTRIEPVAVFEIAPVRAARPRPQRSPGERDESAKDRHKNAAMLRFGHCTLRIHEPYPLLDTSSALLAPARRASAAPLRYASNTNVLCSALWPFISTSMPSL